MKMNYLRPAELIIPLGLLAFIGPGVSILNWVLNETVRWGVLAGLTIFLLLFRLRDLTGAMRSPIFWAIQIYALWQLATVAWSEVPQISLAKALVFFWVVTTMLVAGYSWVMRHERTQTFDFLWLFAVFSLLAATRGESVENLNMNAALYSGMVGNPNLLGFLLAVAGAWLIWRAFWAYGGGRRLFWLYICLLSFDLYSLYLAHSRAAQIMFVILVLGFLKGVGNFRKLMPYALPVIALFAAIFSFSPSVRDFITQYAFKTNLEYLESVDVENAILWSREQIWQESYDLAMQGGMTGGGYGVTIGESFQGEIGATISSGQYGREQGNTQLAVIEQTGLIGFGIYLGLIVSIFGAVALGLRRAKIKADKVAIGLLGGVLAGLWMQSILEAWWVAPGSAESATFWMLLGAMLGVIRRARSDALQHRSSDAMTAQQVTSAHSPAVVTP